MKEKRTVLRRKNKEDSRASLEEIGCGLQSSGPARAVARGRLRCRPAEGDRVQARSSSHLCRSQPTHGLCNMPYENDIAIKRKGVATAEKDPGTPGRKSSIGSLR